MFIKRNRTSIGSKSYSSVLLVQGKRVPAKRPAGRPPNDAGPLKTIVVHETLANLSKLPAELIDVIESFCRDSDPGASSTKPRSGGADQKAEASALDAPVVHLGPCYGLLAGLHALAKELGIVAAVGEATRLQRLALFLVYARLAHQGSRLSAARWSEDHAVREVLDVGSFDEDDLYAALEYVESHQKDIEAALHKSIAKGALFLYDVTSVYFEGVQNELADYGYNRDGKKGKMQMVSGLLTDSTGEPLTIQLYPGNTSDPPTFLDAVQTLKARFGAEEIALVGDRGMIKHLGKQALGEAKFRYVTALTDPQIRVLLKNKTLPLELFDERPAEVEVAGKRYVLRCNPQTRARERERREDQWKKLQGWIEERNAVVEKSPKAKAESSLRQAQKRLQRYRLARWITLRLEGRAVRWTEDLPAKEAEEQLDGCYVIETDLSVAVATTQQVHDRYMDLTKVERDFRTMKTGLLKIRPVFLRKANRTRGHAMVSLLALKLARELDRRIASLGLTVEDAIERLEGVKLVSLGNGEHQLWRLADSYPAAQREVLAKLPKLPAPMLSLGKANKNRLVNPRQGRD
jgi:transposase